MIRTSFSQQRASTANFSPFSCPVMFLQNLWVAHESRLTSGDYSEKKDSVCGAHCREDLHYCGLKALVGAKQTGHLGRGFVKASSSVFCAT